MDIIIFSTADWDNPFWTNKQHMAKVFEKNGHKVIYIDSLGLRKPTATTKDIKRIIKRLKSLFLPYSQVSKNIWKISPFIIPFHSNKVISLLNKWFLVFYVKVLSFYLKFKNPLIWTYSPIIDEIVDLFPNSRLIYHCVDDLSALPGVDSKIIKKKEEALAIKSDIVFTTSQFLYKRLFKLNKNTYYHNNVCDYDHFVQAQEKRFEKPKDLQNISGKKILFIGALSDYKVDFELIYRIARKNKKWQWILIGEIGEGQPLTSIDNLKKINNIHFLGPKFYDELPMYMQHCDVAVIPAKLNSYTKSMFPMKFFEYLTAGKQVITTDLPAIKQYSDLYFNSKTKEEFYNNLYLILEENITKDKNLIKRYCQDQTWQKRYEIMMSIIEKKFKLK